MSLGNILPMMGDKEGRASTPAFAGVKTRRDGGEGSGNFGHAGRPGEIGGSGGGGGGSKARAAAGAKKTAAEAKEKGISVGQHIQNLGSQEREAGKAEKEVRESGQWQDRHVQAIGKAMGHDITPSDAYEILKNAHTTVGQKAASIATVKSEITEYFK